MAFPQARQFERVFTESVGSDIVMYVESGKTMQYHTLANGAYAIWRAADGHRDEAAMAEMVFGDRSEMSIARVETGLVALMDAGLLESSEGMTTTRRGMIKLAAAALLGGAGLPTVVSITAPSSASAHSHLPPTIRNGDVCPTDGSQVCISHCCCTAGSTYGACFDSCPEGYWCANNPPLPGGG